MPRRKSDCCVALRAGWLFGSKVAAEFNAVNGLELICRAHQLVQVRQLASCRNTYLSSPQPGP